MDVINVILRLPFSFWKDLKRGFGLVVERSMRTLMRNLFSWAGRDFTFLVAFVKSVSHSDGVGMDFRRLAGSLSRIFARIAFAFIASWWRDFPDSAKSCVWVYGLPCEGWSSDKVFQSG